MKVSGWVVLISLIGACFQSVVVTSIHDFITIFMKHNVLYCVKIVVVVDWFIILLLHPKVECEIWHKRSLIEPLRQIASPVHLKLVSGTYCDVVNVVLVTLSAFHWRAIWILSYSSNNMMGKIWALFLGNRNIHETSPLEANQIMDILVRLLLY